MTELLIYDARDSECPRDVERDGDVLPADYGEFDVEHGINSTGEVEERRRCELLPYEPIHGVVEVLPEDILELIAKHIETKQKYPRKRIAGDFYHAVRTIALANELDPNKMMTIVAEEIQKRENEADVVDDLQEPPQVIRGGPWDGYDHGQRASGEYLDQ